MTLSTRNDVKNPVTNYQSGSHVEGQKTDRASRAETLMAHEGLPRAGPPGS